MSHATFYRWKKVYGGLMPSEVRRLAVRAQRLKLLRQSEKTPLIHQIVP